MYVAGNKNDSLLRRLAECLWNMSRLRLSLLSRFYDISDKSILHYYFTVGTLGSVGNFYFFIIFFSKRKLANRNEKRRNTSKHMHKDFSMFYVLQRMFVHVHSSFFLCSGIMYDLIFPIPRHSRRGKRKHQCIE